MTTAVTFEEAASFSENIRKFRDFIKDKDVSLGAVLSSHLAALRDSKVSISEVLDDLLSTAKTPGEQGAATVAAISAAAPPPPSPTNVTGWLVAGVSIEGFRGINNEGRPLQLTFHPDKINSISAVNGVGKSSIYDALRYAISGKLPWLDDLPAAEHGDDYYLNRFNTSGVGRVKITLQPDGGGQACEITVTRDSSGKRTVSTTSAWNPDDILADLDREFVFLDGPTFQGFIAETPLNRGRTFAGLLGLSQYSKLRQALSGLANTRAFNNHFGTNAIQTALAADKKAVGDANQTVSEDFRELTGAPGPMPVLDQAQLQCVQALVQVPLLAELCAGKTFEEIEVDELLMSIKCQSARNIDPFSASNVDPLIAMTS